MGNPEVRLGHEFLQRVRQAVDRLDAVVDHEHLAAAGQLLADGVGQDLALVRHDVRGDRVAVARCRLDHREVAHTEQRHLQGARNRSGGHRQHVDVLLELLEPLLLGHAEALLLVDDQQAEVLELHVLGEQPVGADGHVGGAVLDRLRGHARLGRGAESREQLHLHREGGEARLERAPVLIRQHRGGRQDRHLLAFHHGLEGGTHGDLGLAVAHVAAEQAIHDRRLLHVALHLVDGAQLIGRLLVFEGILELALPRGVLAKRVALVGLARGVEREQLGGDLAQRVLDAALHLRPAGAAEPVDLRLGVLPRVELLHQVELVERQVEAVRAAVLDLHELLGVLAHVDLLHADEAPDAVLLVDDVVARIEVAEVALEGVPVEAAAAPLRTGAPEDLGVGGHPEADLGHPEPRGEVRGGDVAGAVIERGGVGIGVAVGVELQRGGHVVTLENLGQPLALAAPRQQHGHALAGLEIRLERVSEFRQPAPVARRRRHRQIVGARLPRHELRDGHARLVGTNRGIELVHQRIGWRHRVIRARGHGLVVVLVEVREPRLGIRGRSPPVR